MANQYFEFNENTGIITINIDSFRTMLDRENVEIFNNKVINCDNLSKNNVKRIVEYSIQRWKKVKEQFNTIVDNQRKNIKKLEEYSRQIDELYRGIGSNYIGNNKKLKINEIKDYQEKVNELCKKLKKICYSDILKNVSNIISCLERINEVNLYNDEKNINFRIINLPVIDNIHENYCRSFV